MCKLRFNLGLGANFMKFQLITEQGTTFHDPMALRFRLHNCKLVNHKSGASKIYKGSHKSVVAWVEFDSYEMISEDYPAGEQIKFNPRVLPFWNIRGENVDGTTYQTLVTDGSMVCLPHLH